MTTEPEPTPAGVADRYCADWGTKLLAHECWLRKVILARTGDSQAVDEVFQRVALAAAEHHSRLADPAKFAPWLHRIAVVQSCRFRRKLGRERRAVAALVERRCRLENGYADDVLALLLAKERRQQVERAMSRLAGRDAEMLLLKYGERWSYRQWARRGYELDVGRRYLLAKLPSGQRVAIPFEQYSIKPIPPKIN